MRKCDNCGAVNGASAVFCGLCHSALIARTSARKETTTVEKANRAPLVLAALAAIVLTVFAWSLTRPSVFSEPTSPKTVVFNWDYESRPYSLELTLHQNIYRFYGNEPKGVLIGREERDLVKYLSSLESDDTIKDLVASIGVLAEQNDLSDEETVELAVAFVQSIPYDFEVAGTDRARTPRYAYEILYDNQGICSEKSYLAYLMLREMGYGAAVFIYPKENHMNIGIQSPLEHSTDRTGYSVVETTNRNIKIGIIPDIDTKGQALQTEALQDFNLRNPSTTKGKNLSSPIVYARAQGNEYAGVIERFQARKELAETQDILEAQSALIKSEQTDLDALRRRLEEYRARNNVRAYNSQVNSYNRDAKDLEGLINDYNKHVSRYNALLGEI